VSKKIISLVLCILFVLSIANSFAFALEDPDVLYNKDGVTVMYHRPGEMDPVKDRAQPIRSGGVDNKERLDAITIYNQSTYGKPEPGRFYYRTVGYRIALLDENKLPLAATEGGLIPTNPLGVPLDDDIAIDTPAFIAFLLGNVEDLGLGIEYNIRGLIDTKYFNMDEIRRTERQNMWNLIATRFGNSGWDKPYVTSMTISRDRLIKELGLEGREYLLDQAKYLLMAGEIEYYQAQADGSEGPALDATHSKIMYSPARKRLVSYFNVPPRYESLRSDKETRMQLINLWAEGSEIIPEEELPDLIVERIDPGTSEAKPGAKHNGKVRVRRAAEKEYSGPADTILYLTVANGKIDGPVDIPVTLSPGETKEIQFTWEAGQDKSKDILIVAEVNPEKLGDQMLAEKTYDNNTKQAVVKMEQERIDLAAMIADYSDAMFVGETYTCEALLTNSAEKAVTTEVVWRIGGVQAKRATVTIPAKGDIIDKANITMPKVKEYTTVKLEVEVNPSRNKPANEITWSNNKDSVSVFCLGVDDYPDAGESPPYLVP